MVSLVDAIMNGDIESIKNNDNLVFYDEFKCALETAIECDQFEIFKYLVSNDDIASSLIKCAYLRAAQSCKLSMMKYLDDNFSIEPRHIKRAVFRESVQCGHVNVIQYLLKTHGNIINEIDYTCNNNILFMIAVDQCNLEMVKLLASLPGIVPSDRDQFAIRCAARHGVLDMVKLLVTLPGVDPFYDHSKPFLVAARRGHVDVVKFLLTLADNNTLKNIAYGCIPSIMIDGQLDVLKELLKIPHIRHFLVDSRKSPILEELWNEIVNDRVEEANVNSALSTLFGVDVSNSIMKY